MRTRPWRPAGRRSAHPTGARPGAATSSSWPYPSPNASGSMYTSGTAAARRRGPLPEPVRRGTVPSCCGGTRRATSPSPYAVNEAIGRPSHSSRSSNSSSPCVVRRAGVEARACSTRRARHPRPSCSGPGASDPCSATSSSSKSRRDHERGDRATRRKTTATTTRRSSGGEEAERSQRFGRPYRPPPADQRRGSQAPLGERLARERPQRRDVVLQRGGDPRARSAGPTPAVRSAVRRPTVRVRAAMRRGTRMVEELAPDRVRPPLLVRVVEPARSEVGRHVRRRSRGTGAGA